MSTSQNRICIIHFQPLEKYPPVTNFLDCLARSNNQEIIVISTNNHLGLTVYENDKVRILRYPTIKQGAPAIIRIFQYLVFYIGCLVNLLIKRPDQILYYETLSSFPAIIYYYLSLKRIKLLVHYHEYNSPKEYKTEMLLSRYFHHFEQKTYSQISWLAHTNKERMELFIRDNPNIKFANTKIMPNYPPSTWGFITKSKNEISWPLKIVYVGATSLSTMFFFEFFEWIKMQEGKVLFDIYSFSYPTDFSDYVKKMNTPYIVLKDKLIYDCFPKILPKYDVGVILYKGHILNYVYNAPNKLFEYLACGLDVWVSQEMEGSQPFVTKDTYPKVTMVDFKNMNTFDCGEAISRKGLRYQPSDYFCEPVYSELANFIVHAKR